MIGRILIVTIIVTCAFVGAKATGKTKEPISCKYESVFVPCLPLGRPVVVGDVHIAYRPLKFIPVWPHNAIFGGYDNVDDGERFKNDFYNRVASTATVPNDHDIRKIDFSEYKFGSDFAERFFRTGRHRSLVKTSEAFRGPEVFTLWLNALEKGVICGPMKTPDEDNAEPVAECGFARRADPKSAQLTIEYCGFQKFATSGAGDEPWCIKVARRDKSGTWILATRYTNYGRLDGEGGAETGLECNFPDRTSDELKDKFGEFFQQYLGESRKYAVRKLAAGDTEQYAFRGDGLKIRDDRENIFERVYVHGTYAQGFLSMATLEKLPGGTIWVHFAITISAQASDSIIDYREPNEGMGNRLHNRLVDQLKGVSRGISARSNCTELEG
jgi:hypothetical protein